MKRRIGTLYNKPIIEGDINLKTINEIHKDELKGGDGKEVGTKILYFKINKDMEITEELVIFPILYGMYEMYSVTNNAIVPVSILAANATFRVDLVETPKFNIIYTDKAIVQAGMTLNRGDFYNFIDNAAPIVSENPDELIAMAKQFFIPITEEEFYKMD